ncbi:MAG: nonstructural protein [Microviridae sp.]|nr:MAG: nonstructural protein [Microviridae sp.]
MKKILCSVKDTAVQAFGPVFVMNTREEAIRSLKHEMNRAESTAPAKQFPDDHELYQVGEWDEVNGKITDTDNTYPELIVRCKDLIQGA